MEGNLRSISVKLPGWLGLEESGLGCYWSKKSFPVLFLVLFLLIRIVIERISIYFQRKQVQEQQEKQKEEKQKDDDEEDFISRLPDDILRIILSKLPIRDAAVTTAVSKQWPSLFPTVPSLKIDADSFYRRYLDFNREYTEKWINALYSVLKSHKVPVKKFEITADVLNRYHGDFDEVFGWLCASGVEELSITNHDYVDYEFFKPHRIPLPVFSCNTIVKLELFNCDLVVPSKLTGLRAVKSLVLCNVTVTDDDLTRMISRCTAMEKLVIITSRFKSQNIVIHAPSLSELVINLCERVRISLQSVPRLASVSVSFGFNFDFWKRYGLPEKKITIGSTYIGLSQFDEVSVGNNEVTKLEAFLNGLGGVKDLRLDFSNEYRMILLNEGIALPTRLFPKCYLFELKKLCLSWPSNHHTCNMILSCLLISSPHLMEIIICVEHTYYLGALELDFWDKELPAECVKHHVTTATFYFDHYISENCFCFPKFLLLNARTLKNMNIFYTRMLEDKSDTAEEIKNELLAVQMASPDVEMTIKPIISRYRYNSSF